MDGIKDTIFKILKIDNLVDNLSGYVETRVELLKIEIREDLVQVIAKGLVLGTIILITLLFLSFFSIGLAQYLNTFLSNSFLGYWIVAGFYFVIFTTLLIFRKSLYRKLEKYFSELIKQNEE